MWFHAIEAECPKNSGKSVTMPPVDRFPPKADRH